VTTTRLIVVFTALAILFTWTLAAHFGDAVAWDAGDPILNAPMLGWDASRLPHALRGVWDAPIFYPYHQTLAFSEHLLGIAVLVVPAYWATHNPLVAYNTALVLSFVLAGLGMFVLARELTGRDDAAWIAGLVFAFMPARMGQISHLQVLMSGWMPLALWALHRFIATTSKTSLAAFATFTLLQCFSNNYFIYFFVVPAAIVAVDGVYKSTAERRRRLVPGLAIAAAVVVCALVPVAAVYFDVRRLFDFKRPLGDA